MELTKQQLEDMYVNQKMTYKEIADAINRSVCYVYTRSKKYNITSRPAGNSRGKPLNENQRKTLLECVKRPKSEEHKKKLSESKKGKNNPNFGKKSKQHGKRHWFTCPDGKSVSMRSTWEVAFAEYLNEQNIKWEYEPRTFILENGSAYTPDFHLTETNEWIEVKGWFRDEHKEKLKTWQKEHPQEKLTLADRGYLQNLGIDLNQKWITSKPRFECIHCHEKFYRKYPDQRLCSVKCRNIFIANGGKLTTKHKPKRKYNGNQSGDRNSSSKLTSQDVREIREMKNQGISVKEIAEVKDISSSNIYNILNRKSWRNI